jgi:hypothetical protein
MATEALKQKQQRKPKFKVRAYTSSACVVCVSVNWRTRVRSPV